MLVFMIYFFPSDTMTQFHDCIRSNSYVVEERLFSGLSSYVLPNAGSKSIPFNLSAAKVVANLLKIHVSEFCQILG